MKRLFAVAAAFGLLSMSTAYAAERVLRTDETGVGELDPHIASDVADSMLLYNIYDTLVFPAIDAKTNEFRPHLAEKIDIDGTTYTVTLRPNLKFHSGNPVTSEDVVFSLNRALAINRGFAYLFRGWIESAQAKDARTVVIKLSKPYTTFYASLTRLGIVDSKLVMSKKEAGTFGDFGDYGQKFLNTNDAGSGAYRVESHKPDELTVMKKFDGYFLPFVPTAPDTVRMAYGLKEPTILTLMQRGEHDIVNQWISPETKKALGAIKGVTHLQEAGIAAFFIKLNNTKPPFDDVHCRKAFALAVDYQALRGIETIGDIQGARPSRGPLLDSMKGFDPTMPAFEKQDMAKAKAELAQCKHKPGSHRIQITWLAEVAKEERIALLLQQNWGELGFQGDVERLPSPLWYQQVAKAETTPMVQQLYSNARTPDPDSYLYNIYHSTQHGQFSAAEYFKDAEVDKMLDEGRAMPNGPARDEHYKKLVRRIVDLQPSIYGYQVVNLYAKRDSVSVPTLEDPKLNTGLMGGNFIFRLIAVKS